ncbi:MAG: AmmeMemoRadiSam system radical SAM enzyme [Planctomycetales bacterium]|nr:AmmeMemoRadiSam system radical SAM enzyme [Planctomycetales bacterium]
MTRAVLLPPETARLPDGSLVGGWWHEVEGEPGRIHCDLCPRDCTLRPGDKGFCFVRENREGQMVLSTYGRSTGFCIDPIEKKPLNHFYPGTSVLSFGTAGCNLGCKFCQNWSISKSREVELLSESASPEAIATAARELGCRSVAFTYNDPVVWAEYAIDTARACRAVGVKTVAVTAGYITPAARGPFYEVMDAANVDLKGFTEEFYQKLTLSHLQPVLDTLRWLKHESSTWFEITNLIIPQANDSPDELKQMCDWILESVGPDVPVHFTAFHPDFRLNDRERTPPATLFAAYEIAKRAGLHYIYAGNIHAPEHQTTYCPGCGKDLIERTGYTINGYNLRGNQCAACGTVVAGHFDERPGNWGSRRQPVRIADYQGRENLMQITSATPSPTTIPPSSSPGLVLLPSQEERILAAATKHLAAAVNGRAAPSAEDFGEAGKLPVMGAFVSAKRTGKLRSCCGFIGQSVSLAHAVAHAAARTAGDDHRFPPISPSELPFLDLEVWLLNNPQPVEAQGEARLAAVEIGKHGLIIERGSQRGLLLPGVATDHNFDAKTFLEHTCLKAELPPTAWREADTKFSTFEGHVIKQKASGGHEPPDTTHASDTNALISTADLAQLANFSRTNLAALLSGATPSYFAFGVSDANVHGIVVSVHDASGRQLLQSSRVSLREKVPLQSTLFTLTENLAKVLQTQKAIARELPNLKLHLAVLSDVAMHGNVAEPDLRGLRTSDRAVAVVERNKTATVFDQSLSPAELLAQAAAAVQVNAADHASVFSLAVYSTVDHFSVTHLPRPSAGTSVRPAAQAGRFYPADPAELSELVDECLAGEPVEKQPVSAVMVPHAGLIYSGRIAADVLRRVEIPGTVIVIGPKHTALGMDWAVAPHETWQIPGAEIPSDPELARQLSEAIPGLVLDAAAHSQEHAIEVELPFLARLAPNSRVVGIAIGSGDLPRCREFATGLANLIRSLPEPPLLVISSDMNHFASDTENRRLDEMAIKAFETLDPETLYSVVRDNHISMCGLLPAVIVLETLRQLGRVSAIERVGYATSAEVSGDTSRVVGYSGLILK